MGLITMVLGITMAIQTKEIILLVAGLVVGSLIGQFLDLNRRLDSLAARLQKIKTGNASGDQNTFVEGFVTSTMLFCVGSMAVLGAIQDGIGESEPTILLTKSVMDGTVAIFFAASFGISVILSSISVLLYQGLITLFAASIMTVLANDVMRELTALGGVLLLGLGLSMLGVARINVINMLPSLVIIVVLGYFFM